MPAKNPSRSWLCVLRQPAEEQRATLLAKAGDRTLVFKAGLLELEGGGLQAWFAAKDPNKLAVMKVRASWMQRNILNVGWHRSEMERWDELSDTGSAWRAFDNSTVGRPSDPSAPRPSEGSARAARVTQVCRTLVKGSTRAARVT